nr:membrane protein of ER body-like protein [Tanacetum cinerariifolium]
MNKWLGQESLFLEISKSIVYGGLMEVIASLSVVASAAASDAATLKVATMAWLPPMRSAGEDYRLAREIIRVTMEVNGVVMANDQFIEELDMREMDLNARKKDLFIQKLDGLNPY